MTAKERSRSIDEVKATSVKVADLKSVEDLLQLVGASGPWNVVVIVLATFAAFISALQSLSYQFLGATPEYWCSVAPLLEANWTKEQILTVAIPLNNETGKYESCLMYDYDYERAVELGYEGTVRELEALQSDVRETVECSSRNFDLSDFKSTVTTEWDLVCDRLALYSTTQAAVPLGKLVGYLVSGYVIGMFGRRPTALFCSAMFLVFGFAAAAAPRLEVYISMKILTTFMDAGNYLACFVLAMELCSSKQRSMVGSLFVMPWALGYMLTPGIAYLVRQWQWLQVALMLPTLCVLLNFWLLPESPRWLLQQHRNKEALQVLKRAARFNRRTLPDDQVLLTAMENIGIHESKDRDDEASGGILTRASQVLRSIVILILRRDLRLRTLSVFFCWFAASIVYYGIAFNSTNLSTDPYMYIFLSGVTEVPSYCLLWPAVRYLGRKRSLVALYVICSVAIAALTALLLTAPGEFTWLLVVFSLVGKMAVTAAFHLDWLFTAEMFPTSYRSLAVGQASMCARIGSTCSPYVVDVLGQVSSWAPSVLFASVSLAAAALAVTLPETRDVDLSKPNDLNRGGHDNEAFEQERRSI